MVKILAPAQADMGHGIGKLQVIQVACQLHIVQRYTIRTQQLDHPAQMVRNFRHLCGGSQHIEALLDAAFAGVLPGRHQQTGGLAQAFPLLMHGACLALLVQGVEGQDQIDCPLGPSGVPRATL